MMLYSMLSVHYGIGKDWMAPANSHILEYSKQCRGFSWFNEVPGADYQKSLSYAQVHTTHATFASANVLSDCEIWHQPCFYACVYVCEGTTEAVRELSIRLHVGWQAARPRTNLLNSKSISGLFFTALTIQLLHFGEIERMPHRRDLGTSTLGRAIALEGLAQA